MLICFGDITSEKNLELWKETIHEKLADARKMDAIGRIAFGVAHEFNNIITPIVTMSQFCMQKIDRNNKPLMESLELIHSSALRAKGVTGKLMTFTGLSPMAHNAYLDLNVCLKENEDILLTKIESGITVNFSYFNRPIFFEGNKECIDEIIMNLFLNAQSALQGNGNIIIRTDMEIIGAEYIERHLNAWPGKFAVLHVSDNGEGIPEETKQNIFDPFYSTREVGSGDGMGLSIIYGLVKNHGGWITYEREGLLTEFKCYFPVKKAKIISGDVQKLKGKRASSTAVLVIDDNKAFRHTIFMTLVTQGYKTIMAKNGPDSLKLIAEKDNIDLIISDVRNFNLIKSLQGEKPYKAIILTTSKDQELPAADMDNLDIPKIHFLEKAAPPEAIITKLTEVMVNNKEQSTQRTS